MKSVSIKVDEEFHRCMKLRATEKGKSIKEYVVGLIEKDLETKKEQTLQLWTACVCSQLRNK